MKKKAIMAGNQFNKNAFWWFLNATPFQQHGPVFKIPLQLTYLTRCLRRKNNPNYKHGRYIE